jgi:uroporphyrinogen-III synthase
VTPEATPAGWRCLVTRAQPQADQQAQALRALGLQAVALPLLAIGPAPDATAVQAAWATLHRQALVMFVSANAVQRFFAWRPPGAAGWPAGVRAAAPGRGTQAALVAAGVPAMACVAPALDAAQSDSEALWAVLQHEPWQGREVLIVRGEEGRDWLADTLRAQGARVHCLAAYTLQAASLTAAMAATLAAAQARPSCHLWLLSSRQAIAQLPALAPGAGWQAAHALAPHPRIATAARAAGFGHVAQVAAEPDAIARWARQHPPLA